jgi:hypothetical protein
VKYTAAEYETLLDAAMIMVANYLGDGDREGAALALASAQIYATMAVAAATLETKAAWKPKVVR